jgi:hypothetical protein
MIQTVLVFALRSYGLRDCRARISLAVTAKALRIGNSLQDRKAESQKFYAMRY